jgi:predicted nucleic acid-binding protein
MARYLIDTDVMIDVSRGSAAAATFVDSLEDLTISIISAHKLIVGARNHRDAAAIDGNTGIAYDLLKRYAKSGGLEPSMP